MSAPPALRRLPALAAVATAFVVALAGCGSSAPAPTQSTIDTSGTPTGTVHVIGSEDRSVYAPLIEGFEKANPGVTIDYSAVPFAQYTSVLQQRLSSGDSSLDVVAVDQPTIASMAARGFLQNISQIAPQVQQASLPTLYDVNTYQGTLYAAPLSTSAQYLFYNTDLLAKAGVTPPSADPAQAWTWEQTLDAAKKVQQQSGAEWGLILEQIELYYQLQSLAESAGGGSGLSGPDNLDPQVTDEGWTKAMTWYSSLFADKVAPRGVDSYSTFPLFSSGKAAFFVGGPWDIGKAAAASGLKWGIAPMPYFDGGKRVTPNGGWSLAINPASPQKAAALKFLEYASTTPEGNVLFSKAEANIPANAAAFESYLPTLSGLGGAASAPAAAITRYDAANTAVARPVSVGYPQFENIINKAFSDIRNGTPVAGALSDAAAQITQAMAQYR